MSTTSTTRLSGVAGALAVKAPVRVATTANIALSGLQNIDGATVAEGERVLVKDQDIAADNGIYNASSGAWSRAKDFNGNRDATTGTRVFVNEGAINATTDWRLSTADPVRIGTSSISWVALALGPIGLLGDGLASTPALAFAADEDTGLYRVDDDTLGVACGGVKILEISPAGLTLVSPGFFVDATVPPGVIREYSGAALPDADAYGKWTWPDGRTVGNDASGADLTGEEYRAIFDVVKAGFGNAGTEDFDNDDTVMLPKRNGRVAAARDDLGGTAANVLDNATALGSEQGSKEITLTEAQLPVINIDNLMTDPGHGHGVSHDARGGGSTSIEVSGSGQSTFNQNADIDVQSNTTGINFDNFGEGEAHDNVQPTIAMNFIIKY